MPIVCVQNSISCIASPHQKHEHFHNIMPQMIQTVLSMALFQIQLKVNRYPNSVYIQLRYIAVYTSHQNESQIHFVSNNLKAGWI